GVWTRGFRLSLVPRLPSVSESWRSFLRFRRSGIPLQRSVSRSWRPFPYGHGSNAAQIREQLALPRIRLAAIGSVCGRRGTVASPHGGRFRHAHGLSAATSRKAISESGTRACYKAV